MSDIPLGYCQCGCGEKTPIAKKTRAYCGHVKGEPIRFINNHHRLLSPVPYIVDKETGCWLWQRAKDEKGYGVLRSNDMTQRAYVVYHKAEYGEIPPHMERHHRCENRACVNPHHLEVVSHTHNMRLAVNTKLTLEVAREIRKRYENGEAARALAKEFGVDRTMVYKLLRNEYWKE
jgi:hypothetical protein